MKTKIAGLALAAACSLAAAPGFAGEKVLAYQSGALGVDSGFAGLLDSLPGAGSYRFDFTSSATAQFTLFAGYVYHYDVFLAPPPRPHSEYLEGDDPDYSVQTDKFGTSASIEFFVPSMDRYFYNAGPEYEYRGVPAGTPVYLEEHYENPYYSAYILGYSPEGLIDYSIKVTQTGVPEPATWAILILGLMGVGAAARRRRRVRTAP